MTLLTVAICTYNRNELLALCLRSIFDQKDDEVEVVVINNHPSERLHHEMKEILEPFEGCRLFHEKKKGLSHARNLALDICQSPFIAYIDDDARIGECYLERALALLQQKEIICLGGHIRSWWYYGRPAWLSEEWGSKPIVSDSFTELPGDTYLWGSNIIFRRDILRTIGGFPINIGMNGNRIGYGAENLVQIELRSHGYHIHYSRQLIIEHIIVPQKLTLIWHLRSIAKSYRDGRRIFPEQYTLVYRLRKYARWPKVLFSSTVKLCTDKSYLYQNWILDVYKSLF